MSDALRYEHVLVVGLGLSGRAAARALAGRGTDVLVIDSACSSELEAEAARLAVAGIGVILGSQDETYLEGRDLVVVSPGVKGGDRLLVAARERGLPIWSEVELAWRIAPGAEPTIVGVTGTNGKTTTTTLIGRILDEAGRRAVVVGNIGDPLVTAVLEEPEGTIFVTELSSFQLVHIDEFRPHVCVMLNITEDHLDWHADFAEYADAKRRIFENQSSDDFAVVNVDDAAARSAAEGIRSRLLPVSLDPDTGGKGPVGLWMDGETMFARIGGAAPTVVIRKDERNTPGDHNLANAMCAAGAAFCLDASPAPVGAALAAFRGLKHRVEFVGSVGEVPFYDDSKATNPDATVKALTAFDKRVVLMLGGRNKGNSFETVARAADGCAAAVVLFGEAAGEIGEALARAQAGFPVESVPRLEDAVARALEFARPDRPVLLSPACASFDAFSDYRERGEAFTAAVAALGGDVADV